MTTWMVVSELYLGSMIFLVRRKVILVKSWLKYQQRVRQRNRQDRKEERAIKELGTLSDEPLLCYINQTEGCDRLDNAHSLTLRDLDGSCRMTKYHDSARF